MMMNNVFIVLLIVAAMPWRSDCHIFGDVKNSVVSAFDKFHMTMFQLKMRLQRSQVERDYVNQQLANQYRESFKK